MSGLLIPASKNKVIILELKELFVKLVKKIVVNIISKLEYLLIIIAGLILLLLGSPNTLSFNRINIITFLKSYRDIYNNL